MSNVLKLIKAISALCTIRCRCRAWKGRQHVRLLFAFENNFETLIRIRSTLGMMLFLITTYGLGADFYKSSLKRSISLCSRGDHRASTTL